MIYNTIGVYTMEIGQIIKHGGVIFDFDYPFYDLKHKKEFEDKFILHFRYNEIGQETLQRFKYMLQDTLTINHLKYLHYYETHQKSKELQWWNNKDYHTEHIRELTTNDNAENITNSNNTSNGKYKGVSVDKGNSISKYLDTPQGQFDILDDGYASNITKDNTQTDVESEGSNDNVSVNNSNSINKRNGQDKETIVTNEYGNIGTTSSGDLVKSWLQDAYINVDKMIFDDCADLFMQIY